jgi:hypothetical protein
MLTMRCDFCRASADESFMSAADARAAATLDGWTRTRRGDRCGACNDRSA